MLCMNKAQALKISHGKNVNNRDLCAKTKNPSNCHSRKHTVSDKMDKWDVTNDMPILSRVTTEIAIFYTHCLSVFSRPVLELRFSILILTQLHLVQCLIWDCNSQYCLPIIFILSVENWNSSFNSGCLVVQCQSSNSKTVCLLSFSSILSTVRT